MIHFNSSGENKSAGCILSILFLQNVYLHPSFHSLKLINYLLVMEKAFWARNSFTWFTRMLLLCTSGFNHCAVSSTAKFISNVKWHLLKNIYGQENDCIKAALFFHRFSLQIFWVKLLILLMKSGSQQWDWMRLLWSFQHCSDKTAFRQKTPSQKAEQTYSLVHTDDLVNNTNTIAMHL